MNKTVNIVIQNNSAAVNTPSAEQLTAWATLAAERANGVGEIILCLMEQKEIQQLNKQFRQKDKPTNVLSFPNQPFADTTNDHAILGDIALCPAIIETEAKEQNKPLMAHWAHMCIHSVLHLLGYDHQTDTEAQIMEQLEIDLLQQLGYENPYE